MHYCETCAYECNKRSAFVRHTMTAKHIKRQKTPKKEPLFLHDPLTCKSAVPLGFIEINLTASNKKRQKTPDVKNTIIMNDNSKSINAVYNSPEIMTSNAKTRKEPVIPTFICEKCCFGCTKQSELNRHILTEKHKNTVLKKKEIVMFFSKYMSI